MYGGAPKWDQLNKYKQGVHAIIACPGRLNDFIEGRQVQVLQQNLLVIKRCSGRVVSRGCMSP